MKKVLFLTTALVASASMAAAEVRISGYGRFGLDYNDAVPAGNATGSTTLTSRLRLQFDMSTETDGGVTFGARFRAQSEIRNGRPASGPVTFDDENNNGTIEPNEVSVGGGASFNGARFFVSAQGLTLGVGNIIGAFEGSQLLYQVANTPTAGIGIDGAGFDYLAANMGGRAFNWDAYSSAGAGVDGVEVIYSGGNWGVHVSYSDASARNPLPLGREREKNTAISAYYTFGDWTVAAAYNDEQLPLGDAGRDLTLIGVSGDLGFMDVTVNYAQGENYGGPGVDSSKVTISAGFDIGAATNMIVYVYDEDSAWNPATDGTGYGFNVAHDLGGGVTLTAGAREASGNNPNNTRFQAGAYFRF
jgi:outer membrane protein OmpU